MAATPERNDLCWCGSGRKYKKCCLDRDRASAPSTRSALDVNGEAKPPVSLAAEMTLVVKTARGVAVRRIPTARPLPGHKAPGYEAEDASSHAATFWGLPDFVCTVGTRPKGNATREVADRLIVIGDSGAVIQVKARVARTDNPEKETSWLHKQIEKAISQGHGTIRALRARPVTATTARGKPIELGGDRHRWLTVVIIDHPSPPDDVVPDLGDAGDDVVVMLRRDWEFLFDQLKSTHAVMTYLQRVRGDTVELGTEPARYYDLAQADANATPGTVDLAQLGDGAQAYSEPLLPMKPAGNDPDDLNALRLIRDIMEDLAITPMTSAPETARLQALAALDLVPIGQRIQIGHLLIEWMDLVAETPDAVRMRRLVGLPTEAHVSFGVAGIRSQEMFCLWLQLRHYERQQYSGNVDQVSIGVQLTPRHDGQRLWDTTMIAVAGPIDFTADELGELQSMFTNELAPSARCNPARSPSP